MEHLTTPQERFTRGRLLRKLLVIGVVAVLAGALGPGATADENAEQNAGVSVSLPAGGDCATPRGAGESTTLDVFEVSGSPATRLVAPQVSAAGAGVPGGIEVPPPSPMRLPARSPCDGAGGPCVAANAAPRMGSTGPVFSEPPPVSSPPPGAPPGIP